ncbi:MAG: DNA-processing protein DprA [Bacteroidales bacterium]
MDELWHKALMNPIDRTELLHRIALTMVPDVGPVTARLLVKYFKSARAVFDHGPEELHKIEGIKAHISGSLKTPGLFNLAEKELKFMEKHRISVHCLEEERYPHLLKECNDAPLLLYVKGEQGLHCKRSLSVVGTRRATAYGKEVCCRLIRELASQLDDLVIVSGLAYGIDVMAHRAALEAGIPTVAVLGHGFGTLYPSAHREVAKKIIRQGALVTDFVSETGPERNNFLRRNRIIAGLSDATLVVESAERGGALITAGLAASYGRDVLAVPGRTIDHRSRGCNLLIKSTKAALVENAEDILYHLNWDADHPDQAEPTLPFPPSAAQTIREKEQRQLFSLVRDEPGITPDTLCIRSGIPIHRVFALLVEMELKELVLVEPGNRYHLRVSP